MNKKLRDKLNKLISIKERCRKMSAYIKNIDKNRKNPQLNILLQNTIEYNYNTIISSLRDNKNLNNIKNIIKDKKYISSLKSTFLNSNNFYIDENIKILDNNNSYWKELEEEYRINKHILYSLWINNVFYTHKRILMNKKFTEEIINFLEEVEYKNNINLKENKDKLLIYSYFLKVRPIEIISFYTKINNKGKWTVEEDKILIKHVEDNGESWKIVSKGLERTDMQCRERYKNHLEKNIIKNSWRKEEDEILLELKAKGKGWADISKAIKGRTDMQCRKRYIKLLK